MKKKRLVCDEWTVITSKRYKQRNIDNEFFRGIVALLYLDEVVTPQIWEFNGQKNVVCDTGMKWLQMIPSNDTYVITCLLYTSDAADEEDSVDLGGRRIIKKKKKKKIKT